jgi:hypothetical protein
LRSKLVYGGESLAITNIDDDLPEVIHITQNLSGMPPYKLKIFKEVFLPLYKTKLQSRDTGITEYNDGKGGTVGGGQEDIIAVTSRELCDYYKEKTGKTINSNNLKQNYLNEFIHNGLIDQEDSVLDKRQKLYYPITDLSASYEEQGQEDSTKIKKLTILSPMDNFLQYPKMLVPKNCMAIPKNWLELEIFELLKYPLKLDKFELYNEKNERLCICNFVKSYEKNTKLNGYFSKPVFCNYHSKVFGNMRYLRRFNDKECKKLSIGNQMDNFGLQVGREVESDDNSKKKVLERCNNGNSNRLKPLSSPVVSIEEFFHDLPDLPYTPLPVHSLDQSPCYPIIGMKANLYFCKLHPEFKNIHLETIEHHCKYQEPDNHKSEITKLLQSPSPSYSSQQLGQR